MRLPFFPNPKPERPAPRTTHHGPRTTDHASRITHYVSRFTFHASRTTHHAPRSHETGIALVITLILLAVITFMAITFLVLSTRERNAVTTTTDQATARFAAEAALERVKADMIARILATTNANNYDLFASVAYQNPFGFVPSGQAGFSAFTNVNYDYKSDGSAFTLAERYQNLVNLFYDPKAPVYVVTNRATGSNELRHYIDLNRNGLFEPSGLLTLTNDLGQPMSNPTNAAQLLTASLAGDPQWIGILERPGFPHSPTNRFVARIAYLALPASKTLDLNYLFNAGKKVSVANTPFTKNDYRRNMGVGAWEDNLAAFFRDLNTNIWPTGTYNYITNDNTANIGFAFDDARRILGYRTSDFTAAPTAKSVSVLFGKPGSTAFAFDHIDEYCNGPLMVGTTLPAFDNDAPLVNAYWFGADNTNHFFSLGDLFDPNKTGFSALGSPPVRPCFTDHLIQAGTNTSTYNRYTFYRLLGQLGTDSAPEPTTKMNLNYDNLVQSVTSNTPSGPVVIKSAANFLPWRPTDFFTNAASRLLADMFSPNYANIGRIPVYPTNNYTPSVHRLLQLSANLYDATTNQYLAPVSGAPSLGVPSVFRPLFRREASGQIIIAGFRETVDDAMVNGATAPPYLSLEFPSNSVTIPTVGTPFDPIEKNEPMVSGIPLVIGAKKGWPSFNQFAMETLVNVTRKMDFERLTPTNAPIQKFTTNLMYVIGITNSVGLEAWNSYVADCPRPLEIFASVNMSALIYTTNQPGVPCATNGVGTAQIIHNTNFLVATTPGMTVNAWPGWDTFNKPFTSKLSFQVPIQPGSNTFGFLSQSKYSALKQQFLPQATDAQPGDFVGLSPASGPFYVPQWILKLSTKVRFYLIDPGAVQAGTGKTARRIIDFVNFDTGQDNVAPPINLTEHLIQGEYNAASRGDPLGYTNYYAAGTPPPYKADGSLGSMFCTNRTPWCDDTIFTYGMSNQTAVCINGTKDATPNGIPNCQWKEFADQSTIRAQVNKFRYNLLQLGPVAGSQPTETQNLQLTPAFQAPYNPTRTVSYYVTWRANDPLVHYMVGDLADPKGTPLNPDPHDPPNFGMGNRYSPIPYITDRRISPRYDPTGGPPASTGNDSTAVDVAYDLRLKDPGLFRSDYWDFPTNKLPNVGWIGRVHRGTPWQTMYFKQPPIDMAAWTNHSGNGRLLLNTGQVNTAFIALSNYFYEAALTMPTNDWRVIDLFTTAVSDNASHGQMSINQSGLAAWSAILSGVLLLTNNSDPNSIQLPKSFSPPPSASLVADPAGAYDPYNTAVPLPPLVQLVNAINATRGDTNKFPQQTFSHLGDILAVPELTVNSPFLNHSTDNDSAELKYGINDEMYERIPQQILGLLKVDSAPRYVIYSWGQALKPADRSVVMSGTYSGLCTNYQISAEVQTRATIRVEGLDKTPFKPRIIVESYNIMPPD